MSKIPIEVPKIETMHEEQPKKDEEPKKSKNAKTNSNTDSKSNTNDDDCIFIIWWMYMNDITFCNCDCDCDCDCDD